MRIDSIHERDKNFIQTTDQDIQEKGDLDPQRILDTYLKFADRIDFVYRDDVHSKAKHTATWIRSPDSDNILKKGSLTIIKEKLYNEIKKIHNAVCDKLEKEDLKFENTLEELSIVTNVSLS